MEKCQGMEWDGMVPAWNANKTAERVGKTTRKRNMERKVTGTNVSDNFWCLRCVRIFLVLLFCASLFLLQVDLGGCVRWSVSLVLGDWPSVCGKALWVPHQVKRRSLTRPLFFAHPWRSAEARCVTSKRTDFAEEPKPSSVVREMGATPTLLPHTRGRPYALSGFRLGCCALRCAPQPWGVVPSRLVGCT